MSVTVYSRTISGKKREKEYASNFKKKENNIEYKVEVKDNE